MKKKIFSALLAIVMVLCALLAGALLCIPVWKLCADKNLYNSKTQNYDYINRWSSTQVYLSKGFVYPFLHSATTGTIKAPAGYHQRETAALLASYEDADIPPEKQVDVIPAIGGLCRFLAV